MTIDRIGPMDPIKNYTRSHEVNKKTVTRTEDSISVSDEARRGAEILKTVDIVRSLPEVRQDRIDAIKARFADPNYSEDKDVARTAEEIMKHFGL